MGRGVYLSLGWTSIGGGGEVERGNNSCAPYTLLPVLWLGKAARLSVLGWWRALSWWRMVARGGACHATRTAAGCWWWSREGWGNGSSIHGGACRRHEPRPAASVGGRGAYRGWRWPRGVVVTGRGVVGLPQEGRIVLHHFSTPKLARAGDPLAASRRVWICCRFTMDQGAPLGRHTLSTLHTPPRNTPNSPHLFLPHRHT